MPSGPVDIARAAAAVLAQDGRAFALQPWQVAYLLAVLEARPPLVPSGCGVGKGWLDDRLREALADEGHPAPS